MKLLIKTIALTVLTLLPLTAMTAESDNPISGKTYKIVFDVTSDGPEEWLGVLTNVENLFPGLIRGTALRAPNPLPKKQLAPICFSPLL